MTDPPTAVPASFDRTLVIPLGAGRGDQVGGPDWMAAGFGSLWIHRDNNVVERISPDGKRLATIDAGLFREPVCQGIGVTDTAVWSCASTDTLIRIDPATEEYSIVKVPKLNEQGRLASGAGLLWVLNSDGDSLQGVDDTGTVEREIDLGTFCSDTAETAPGDVLWVACAYDGKLLRVDLVSGDVTGAVDGLPHVTAVTAPGDVWAGDDDGLVHVDTEALAVVSVVPIRVTNLRTSGSDVYVREDGEQAALSVVDAETGDIVSRSASPEVAFGGDVIEVGGRRWLTSVDDNFLLRLGR